MRVIACFFQLEINLKRPSCFYLMIDEFAESLIQSETSSKDPKKEYHDDPTVRARNNSTQIQAHKNKKTAHQETWLTVT